MAAPLTSLLRTKRQMTEALRHYPLSCCVLVSMATATLLLQRYLHVLMLFWSFLFGAVTFYCSLSPESLLPSLLLTTRTTQQQQQRRQHQDGGCAVCGLIKCKRHRPTLLLENFQPWVDLKLPNKVDASITEIFELVLENFVYPWYSDITDDEAFVDELRSSFRFLASVMLRRAHKVDVASLLSHRVMQTAMKHIQVIATARAKVTDAAALQQAALDEYGAELHVALRSRKHELMYLRKLTQQLFSHLMPPRATECRSLALLLREVVAGSVLLPTMDFLADPDTVNLMVLMFVDDSPPLDVADPPSPLVPFLQKYADVGNKKLSVLQLQLKQIRDQQELLFRFINFLKQEGAVHVLQFCLAAEEFNDRILSPDLKDQDLKNLHQDLQSLCQTYFLDRSPDRISFSPEIQEELKRMSSSPYQEVVKLQTMRSLFEAYEHVLSLLENIFTPMFCHSHEYFRFLLRGAESLNRNSKTNRSTMRRGEAFGISRIGSRIKGVFRSTTIEGSVLPPSGTGELEEEEVEEGTVVLEDDSPVPLSTAGSHRNLSAWSVSIPYVHIFEDEAKRDKIPVFSIQVERHDRREVGHDSEHWSVYRKYLEFYVLESKLTEFHGPFADAQLPTKRILGPKNYEFLVSKREEFEEYLQRLLQHPELKNSQLLADFLSPHSLESQFLERILPDLNIGKIFKSVPGKLIKERGQNLEPFLQNFFSSCESPRAKPSRPELTVLSPTANKKLFSSLYKNNANLDSDANIDIDANDANDANLLERNRTLEPLPVDGMYDCMMFLGRVLFQIPDWLLQVLSAGRILFKNSVEVYMDQIIQTKVDQILQEHRLLSLITQLRDAIFCESSEQRSDVEKRARAKKTLEEMMKYLPDAVGKCVGEEAERRGTHLLFQCLQQPLLNKQLSYLLLDITVGGLFPEMEAEKNVQVM